MVDDRQTAVTHLLSELSSGDSAVADRLMPLVYDELRELAAGYLRHERAGHTLQPTALAHEAYLKLVGQREVDWKSRAHFLAVAATAMRRILGDHARRRLAAKRGGGLRQVTLSGIDDPAVQPPLDAIALDDVLSRLHRTDGDLYRLVERRFFGGMTVEEVALVMDVSRPTVERHWRLARAWLSTALRDE
jgi:RNA polymerase sigma factor (TIGR02999 family)